MRILKEQGKKYTSANFTTIYFLTHLIHYFYSTFRGPLERISTSKRRQWKVWGP